MSCCPSDWRSGRQISGFSKSQQYIMSAEQNKILIKEFIQEVINKKRFDLLEKYCSDNFTIHIGTKGEVKTLAEFRRVNTESGGGTAFPDFKVNIEDIVAEGDKVVMRYTISATHLGEFMGASPTGKKINWRAIVEYLLKDDKLSEGWLCEDTLSILSQLGIKELP